MMLSLHYLLTLIILASSMMMCSGFVFRRVPAQQPIMLGHRPTASVAAAQRIRTAAMSSSQSTTNYGEDMDQAAMMESDTLVTVDQNDVLVKTAASTAPSKKVGPYLQ